MKRRGTVNRLVQRLPALVVKTKRPTMALVVTLAQVASAGVLSGQQFSTRVFGGYGTTTGYGPGVGADAGIQFPFPFLVHRPVFLGVWGVYHAGEEFVDEDLGIDVKQSIAMYGLEAAGIWLEEPVYIRGSGILGVARVSQQFTSGPDVQESNFLLSGGILIGKRFGRVFIGVEPTFPLVFGSDVTGTGFALYLNIGYVGRP